MHKLWHVTMDRVPYASVNCCFCFLLSRIKARHSCVLSLNSSCFSSLHNTLSLLVLCTSIIRRNSVTWLCYILSCKFSPLYFRGWRERVRIKRQWEQRKLNKNGKVCCLNGFYSFWRWFSAVLFFGLKKISDIYSCSPLQQQLWGSKSND